jgi:hypothetical protein
MRHDDVLSLHPGESEQNLLRMSRDSDGYSMTSDTTQLHVENEVRNDRFCKYLPVENDQTPFQKFIGHVWGRCQD